MGKLRIRRALILIISLFVFLLNANIIFAGFGVAPSEVWNNKLMPGSHFEQAFYLVQSKPLADLKAEIELDAPEIEKWITFERGKEFIIPAGTQQFPVKVIVDVPGDAEFKSYSGKIWIRTSPVAKEGEGMVGIALGAVVDIRLAVISEAVYGFAFRGITIKDVEQGQSIKVTATLQNAGNVENGPSKIHLDVYDVYLKGIIWSGEVTNIEAIKPFETRQIEVRFPNKLDIGTYFGAIEILKDEQSIGTAKQAFNVLERTGIIYKIFSKWYSWVILAVVILIVVAIKFRKKIKEIISNWRTKRLEKKKVKLEEKLKKLGR